MRWFIADIADAVTAGLQARAQADDLEQAVYGFDTHDELALHPLIQQALRSAGFGVWVEQRYPGDRHRRNRSEGKRCDIVLTHSERPLADPLLKGTLFENLEAEDPAAAYWLEIKTVAQFEIDGPFKRYAAELLAPVAEDVKKINQDGIIQHGGLLLVLFTRDEPTASHDLTAWHQRCLQRGYPVGPPAIRGFPITDRIGNGWCSIAMFGVRGV